MIVSNERILSYPSSSLLSVVEVLRLESALNQSTSPEVRIVSPPSIEDAGDDHEENESKSFLYDVEQNSGSSYLAEGHFEPDCGDERDQLHLGRNTDGSFENAADRGDETIDWSSREEEKLDIAQNSTSKRSESKRKSTTSSNSRRASFLNEDSLEEISDFVDTNDGDSAEENTQDWDSSSGEEDAGQAAKLTSNFAKMRIAESAFPITALGGGSRKEEEYLKWLQGREERDEGGAMAAYSSSSSSSGMIRKISLAYALSAHMVVDKEKTRTSEYESIGGTLIVTSKPLVEEWLKVASRAAGGKIRFEDYTTSLNKRRFLRVNKKAVDIVVTTWDILKAKEEHGERSRLHSLSWLNVVVDFGESRSPGEKNQAGRAIQSVEAHKKLALVQAELDSSRIGKDPLMTETFLRNTIRALLHFPSAVPVANLLFDGRNK